MNNTIQKELILACNQINKEIFNLLTKRIKTVCDTLYSESNIGFINTQYIKDILLNDNLYPIISILVFYFKCYKNEKISIGESVTGIKIERNSNNYFLLYLILYSSKKLLLNFINDYKTKIEERLILNNSQNKLRLFKSICCLCPSLETINDIQISYFLLTNSDDISILQKIFKIKYTQDGIITKRNTNKDFFLKLIGISSIFRVGYKFIKQLRNTLTVLKEKENNKEIDVNKIEKEKSIIYEPNEDLICYICLDKFNNISVTPCGHLFCWNCIIKSTQKNNLCPKCRKKCLPNQIVLLNNFSA